MRALATYGESPERGHYAQDEAGSRIEVFDGSYRLVGFEDAPQVDLTDVTVDLYLDAVVLNVRPCGE